MFVSLCVHENPRNWPFMSTGGGLGSGCSRKEIVVLHCDSSKLVTLKLGPISK